MSTITTTQTQALATFINRCRPDWDHPGIAAAITKAARMGEPLTIAAALVRLASNPELTSPGLLSQPGRHWQVGPDVKAARESYDVPCPDHPEHVHPCPLHERTTPPLDDPEYVAAKAALKGKQGPHPKFVTPKTAPDADARREQLRQAIEQEAIQ